MASVPVRQLETSAAHQQLGDLYLAQYVAPAVGDLVVYCSYQLRATNENNWALMRGWIDGQLEYSGYDTLFSNASLVWTDRHPISTGAGGIVLLQQDNRGADPAGNKAPLVDFIARRTRTHLIDGDMPDIDRGEPSKSRYDERIAILPLDQRPSFYYGHFVAPIDGHFEVDYFVQLSATQGHTAKAESMVWLNGQRVLNRSDQGFGSIPIEYKTNQVIKQGEMFSVLIYDWNIDASPSNRRMSARFVS